MPVGVFLINGIRISYHLIEAAIKWAQENEGSLIGVYMYSDEKNAESYGFPSDIEKVETEVSENEGEAELDTLIRKHIDYAEKQIAKNNIPVITHQLKNLDIDELASIIQSADILWLDPEMFKEEADADVDDLSVEDISDLTDAEIVEITQ